MTNVTLTPAQERALEWLPGDGTWRALHREEADALGAPLRELDYRYGLARCRIEPAGPGFWTVEFCATPAGLALRASRQPHQAPPEPAKAVGRSACRPSRKSGRTADAGPWFDEALAASEVVCASVGTGQPSDASGASGGAVRAGKEGGR
jgi:hypothetical protein